MRDSEVSVALNFLMEDMAALAGVEERGRSLCWEAAERGRFGVNGMGRLGLGVDVGAIVGQLQS